MDTGSHPWVLIVEDDDSLASGVAEMLEQNKFRVVRSGKAPEAIVKLRNQKFELVLLDMKLETGNGEQIVQYMRSNPKDQNAHTPILVMSGFLDPLLIRRVASQVNGVLVKPFSPEALLHKAQVLISSNKKAA